MKKSILLFLAIFCFQISLFTFNCSAQTPDWLWAKTAVRNYNAGPFNQVSANSIAIDASGNIFVAGTFSSDTIIFDTTKLVSAGYDDLFLVKYNSNGNIIWAKRAGGKSGDVVTSVAVDVSGNAYITGHFDLDTLVFDTINLINAGNSDIFIAKYDPAGNVIWAKSIGGTNYEYANSIATDVSGNIFITGSFGSSTILFDTITLNNPNLYSYFLAKYDAGGHAQWAKTAKGTYWDVGTSVAIDTAGNPCVTGHFLSNSIIFGNDTLTNATFSIDIFLAKYGANGNLLWAKSAGEINSDFPTSVAIDASGNNYITGYFGDSGEGFHKTSFFDSLANAGYYDIFLAKYNLNGNVIWSKSFGGIHWDIANSIALDTSGNLYITGYYNSPTLPFNSTLLTNTDSADIFVVKLDTSGTVLWAKSVGGTGDDAANSIAMDHAGKIYVAGTFNSGTLVFGATTLANLDGYSNIFLAKLDSSLITGLMEMQNFPTISLFPNPATTALFITLPQKSQIQILNIQGQLIRTISKAEKETTIDIRDLSSGVYIIKAITEDGMAVKKFVKE